LFSNFCPHTLKMVNTHQTNNIEHIVKKCKQKVKLNKLGHIVKVVNQDYKKGNQRSNSTKLSILSKW